MSENQTPLRKPVPFRWAGHSRDHRTNLWSVECGKCGKSFNPPTTMVTWQSFDCPKCGARHTADWNAEIVEYTP